MLKEKTILLVISGGIAAYKALELIRLLRKQGAAVRCILTKGGAQFITPLSVSALSEHETCTDLWSLKDETEMGHIRLAREADMVVVAPASANLLAKMARGLADDLASTTLLATDTKTPILACPAMNPAMWQNPATKDNIAALQNRPNIVFCGPADGDTACGETGTGRMEEPEIILNRIIRILTQHLPLQGKTALVTSGPTYEPLDPVRFIGNRSSGKQGHAIAESLARAGASVTLITGPVALPDPPGVKTVHVETAEEMLNAAQSAQNAASADIVVCAAAVADWRPESLQTEKIKKSANAQTPDIRLTENPDILATLSRPGPNRPELAIGFAAETEQLLENARAKRLKKGCDWILANTAQNTFGAAENHVYLIDETGTVEEWPKTSKQDVADRLTARIAEYLRVQTVRTNAAE